jgi:hypothetical protein
MRPSDAEETVAAAAVVSESRRALIVECSEWGLARAGDATNARSKQPAETSGFTYSGSKKSVAKLLAVEGAQKPQGEEPSSHFATWVLFCGYRLNRSALAG